VDAQGGNDVPAASNLLRFAHRPKYNNRMDRMQAFRYRLRPTGGQERRMRRFAGACRYVYNRALADQRAYTRT
jgi:putative transposase